VWASENRGGKKDDELARLETVEKLIFVDEDEGSCPRGAELRRNDLGNFVGVVLFFESDFGEFVDGDELETGRTGDADVAEFLDLLGEGDGTEGVEDFGFDGAGRKIAGRRLGRGRGIFVAGGILRIFWGRIFGRKFWRIFWKSLRSSFVGIAWSFGFGGRRIFWGRFF